ncbi:MAG: hypothetical protein EOP84_19635 [Verrucomicrobiaceae bacterium]|nr:MAG: hypothetical protein EOP84_19635 [Verrucomicrobiaceae bacterium]
MPSRSLTLYSQENLQALFMTEEVLDIESLARHVAALPGMHACALFAGDEAAQSGDFPSGFDLTALREMGVQFVSTATAFGGRLLGRGLENVTIQGGGYSATLFARAGLCLCVVHRARGFLPGVREKLAAVADELARGV